MIVTRDSSGNFLYTSNVNQGYAFNANSTGFSVKVLKVRALQDQTIIGVDLAVGPIGVQCQTITTTSSTSTTVPVTTTTSSSTTTIQRSSTTTVPGSTTTTVKLFSTTTTQSSSTTSTTQHICQKQDWKDYYVPNWNGSHQFLDFLLVFFQFGRILPKGHSGRRYRL